MKTDAYNDDWQYGFASIDRKAGNMTAWFATLVRKIIVGASSVWLMKLVEMGIFTQEQADSMTNLTIQFVIAIGLIVGSALWTLIKDRFFSGKVKG